MFQIANPIEDIVNIEDLSRSDIQEIIKEAEKRRELYTQGKRNSKELDDRNIALLFYQKSTRTYGSFERAARRLGMDTLGFLGTEGTSIKKGESVFNTVKMYEALDADAIVMRHPNDGSVQWAADCAEIPVINGGDGRNQHPTQTLLDLVTINQLHPGIDNLHIGFGGDLKNGRTVHSLPMGLSHFDNITLHLVSPEILSMPEHFIELFEKRGLNIEIHDNLRDTLEAVEIFYQTRPQTNMSSLSPEEMYAAFEPYRITLKVLEGLDTKILHPMPIDSKNAEIDFEVSFTPNQYWLQQAANGPFTRQAILLSVIPEDYQRFNGQYDSKWLLEGNNCLEKRITRGTPKDGLNVIAIDKGIVIDHLPLGTSYEVKTALLKNMGGQKPTIISADNLRPRDNPHGDPVKDMIKIEGLDKVDYRMMKSVVEYAPDATFNIVDNKKVVRKFKALICKDRDGKNGCISHVINEDVTPKFELVGDKVRCRYCGTPHSLDVSATDKEKQEYIAKLPKT